MRCVTFRAKPLRQRERCLSDEEPSIRVIQCPSVLPFLLSNINYLRKVFCLLNQYPTSSMTKSSRVGYAGRVPIQNGNACVVHVLFMLFNAAFNIKCGTII